MIVPQGDDDDVRLWESGSSLRSSSEDSWNDDEDGNAAPSEASADDAVPQASQPEASPE